MTTELRKINVKHLEPETKEVRKIKVNKLEGYKEKKTKNAMRRISIRYKFEPSLIDKYISVSATIKKLIESGLTDDYLKNILMVMVDDINIKSFIDYFMKLSTSTVTDKHLFNCVIVAKNFIFILDFLFRKHGVVIISDKEFDKFMIRYRRSATFCDLMRREDISIMPYDDMEKMIIKNGIVIERSNNIENNKIYEGSDVFVNIATGLYKRIPYRFFKKLNKIKEMEFRYIIKEYDPHIGMALDGCPHEIDDEDGTVTYIDVERTIKGVNNIIYEFYEHFVKTSFNNNEIIPQMALNFSIAIVDVKMIHNNGTIKEYDNIMDFIDKEVPGLF